MSWLVTPSLRMSRIVALMLGSILLASNQILMLYLAWIDGYNTYASEVCGLVILQQLQRYDHLLARVVSSEVAQQIPPNNNEIFFCAHYAEVITLDSSDPTQTTRPSHLEDLCHKGLPFVHLGDG